MRRAVQKYANFVLFGVLLFLIMVAILFNWVSHLVHPAMKTASSHRRGDIVFSKPVVREIIDAEHVPERGSKSITALSNKDTLQAWVVVNEHGIDVRHAPAWNSTVISRLPPGITLLGHIIRSVWMSESELSLDLLVAHPMVGWLTVSETSIVDDTATVIHHVRPLELPRIIQSESGKTAKHSHSESQTQAYCGNSSHHLQQMDYRGGDLPGINPVQVNSAIECCQQCCANPTCTYWTLVGQGECWLKTSAAVLAPGAAGKVLTAGAAPADRCGSKPMNKVQSTFIPENELPGTSTQCCVREPVVKTLSSESESARVFFTGLKYLSSYPACLRQGLITPSCMTDVPEQDVTALSALLTTPVTLADRLQALDSAVTTAVPANINLRRTLQHLPMYAKDRHNSIAIPHGGGAKSIHQAARLTSDWTEQQVVGNGRFGALVGGNLRSEIIPVSVAGLFVKRKDKGAGPKFTPDQFRAAREDLKNQQYAAADKKMSSYIKKNLGMFQYVADMAIVYSPTPISWNIEPPPPPSPPAATAAAAALSRPVAPVSGSKVGSGKVGKTPALRRALPRPRNHGLTGRVRILRDFYDHLSYAPAGRGHAEDVPGEVVRSEGDRPPFGDILVSDGVLDIQHGIAHTSIIERSSDEVRAKSSRTGNGASDSGGDDSMATYIRAHHREWFASAKDNVLVGSMTCQSNQRGDGSDGQDKDPCLHAALKFLRENDPKLAPRVEYAVLPVDSGEKWQALWGLLDGDGDTEVTAVHVEIHLSSTEDVFVPETVTRATVVCVGAPGEVSLQQHRDGDGQPVLLCNRAQRVFIVMSVESNGRTFLPGQDTTRDLEALKAAVRRNVQRALEKGFVALKQQHMGDFGEKMGRLELQIAPHDAVKREPVGGAGKKKSLVVDPEKYYTCAASQLSHRLESFTDGCSVPSEGGAASSAALGPVVETVDTELAVQLYQYGRYLLLSSAAGAVANLQGLWADGPGSAWNGDYHLNINLQMAYWAADAVRLPEVMPPLRGFVKALSQKGTEVVAQMYGCEDPQAWTAHGFVDADLDGFPYGDNQWALCVTCGAWAALSVWEHLIMQEVDDAVLVEVTETLRGVVLFFREHMWRENIGDGAFLMHTGPTTSPENSYVLLQTGNAVQANEEEVKVPPLGRAKPGPPPPSPAHGQTAQQQPYSVQQLAFSPALDVSVLRQVAQAFAHCVAWAQDLAGKEDRTKETFTRKFVNGLKDDSKLANEYLEMVTHMPGGGLPVTDTSMHDAAHDLRAHLARVSAQRAGVNAKHHGAATILADKGGGAGAGQQPGQNSGVTAAQPLVAPEPPLPVHCTEEQGGCIREYPAALSLLSGADSGTAAVVRSETLDIGHRHFSALHWVYPNSFVPSTDSVTLKALYRSAFNTLSAKRAHGGGHTGWSAVWEASLWARLRRSEDAYGAIEKFIRTFVAPNLLSLHPPLVSKSDVECGTCFDESSAMMFQRRQQKLLHTRLRLQGGGAAATQPLMTAQTMRVIEDVALQPRGMVTSDQSKFQIDGNLGYMAALNEMLLQSHMPGYYYLLPALPHAFSARCHVYGLQARGGVRVSIHWRDGAVTAAEIVFGAPHPWIAAQVAGADKGISGKVAGGSAERVALGFTSPNPLRRVPTLAARDTDTLQRDGDALPDCEVQLLTAITAEQSELHTFRLDADPHSILMLQSEGWHHCVLRLCGAQNSEHDCQVALQAMVHFSS